LLNPDQQGLAMLTARTLTKATTKRANADLEKWLAERAATLTAASARQSFSLGLSMPGRFSADLFAMLNEVLTSPAFNPDDIGRDITSQIAAIRASEDTPLGLAFRRIPAFLFQKGPYSYLSQGHIEQVEKFGTQQVTSFWATQRTQPWVLGVVGDFDREAVISFAKTLPKPSAKAVRSSDPDWGKGKNLDISMPGRNQAHLLLIFKAVPDSHPDAPALALLTEILAGQSGPLFKDLRDKNSLGYAVSAFYRSTEDMGYLAFYIGTEPDKLQESKEGFARVIQSLHQNLPSDDDLDRGKNQMEAAYYRDRQSLFSRASEAATLGLLGRPLSYNRDRIAKSAATSAVALQKIAKKYLVMDQAYVVIVEP
jgi:zinc protease